MLARTDSDEIPLDSLMIIDQTHFYIKSDINKQNIRYRFDENPMIIHEEPLQSSMM